MRPRIVALGVALFALPAGDLFAVGPGPIQFPLIGIGAGQTLRLNAVASDPGPVNTPAGCAATLSFANPAGAVMVNPGPIQINLAPGESAFLDFPVQLALARAGQRIELRPMVSFPAAGGGTDCVFAAEIFDQLSGFSQVFSQPESASLPGNPATFSLMGVAFGETLRLNAVAVNPGPINSPAAADVPPGPCVVTLGFVDASGTQVQPGPVQITLNPGEGRFLDLPAVQLVHRLGQRALVRPVVAVESLPGAEACAGVASAAELFDLFGRTQALQNPRPRPGPDLGIAKFHSGNFTQGQQNATYTLLVSNALGAGTTSGTVTVTEIAPSGLTLVSMSGTGWNCPTLPSCTSSNALAGGSSYPPITVTVNVLANATSPQVNQASVSGGGSASANTSDSTVIEPVAGQS